MHPFVSILIQILVKLKFLNHQGNRKLVQKLHNLRNQGSTCREVDGATFGTRYWDVQKNQGFQKLGSTLLCGQLNARVR